MCLLISIFFGVFCFAFILFQGVRHRIQSFKEPQNLFVTHKVVSSSFSRWGSVLSFNFSFLNKSAKQNHKNISLFPFDFYALGPHANISFSFFSKLNFYSHTFSFPSTPNKNQKSEDGFSFLFISIVSLCARYGQQKQKPGPSHFVKKKTNHERKQVNQ